MNFLKRWFVRHFITQDEVDLKIRRMIVEGRVHVDQNQNSNGMELEQDLRGYRASDHKIPPTRYYLPPKD